MRLCAAGSFWRSMRHEASGSRWSSRPPGPEWSHSIISTAGAAAPLCKWNCRSGDLSNAKMRRQTARDCPIASRKLDGASRETRTTSSTIIHSAKHINRRQRVYCWPAFDISHRLQADNHHPGRIVQVRRTVDRTAGWRIMLSCCSCEIRQPYRNCSFNILTGRLYLLFYLRNRPLFVLLIQWYSLTCIEVSRLSGRYSST